jgi:hypothetical protein
MDGRRNRRGKKASGLLDPAASHEGDEQPCQKAAQKEMMRDQLRTLAGRSKNCIAWSLISRTGLMPTKKRKRAETQMSKLGKNSGRSTN